MFRALCNYLAAGLARRVSDLAEVNRTVLNVRLRSNVRDKIHNALGKPSG